MGRTLGAVLGASIAISMSPAHADWQTTKWGMSPEQVLTAAPAGAVLKRVDPRGEGGAKIEVDGTYSAGDHQYDASMFFDPSAGLSSVMLVQRSVGDCTATLSALVQKYGQPSGTGAPKQPAIWTDKNGGNVVEFQRVSEEVSRFYPLACSVIYRPIKSVDGL